MDFSELNSDTNSTPFSSQESGEFDLAQPAAKRQCTKYKNNEKYDILAKTPGWQSWDVSTVAMALSDEGFTEEANKFKENDITGNVLPMLTEDHLEELGISKLGRKLQVLKFIRDITGNKGNLLNSSQRKVFNDPIHGHIAIHNVCVKIIDTPQFQRLRFLKQLGTCYFVYPGATHNRFEHSLGVCYLAGKLVRAIRRRQPELNITDTDVLCVEIAGLCHDLGHGPFSHLFDGKFIPKVSPGIKWKHEDASRKMFHYMLEENNLKEEFEKAGLTDKDIVFIEEQVAGPKKLSDNKEWCYEGRTRDKSFLYEIVANKRNGIDVDKWDYFARDCHMLGIRNNFDHHRCFHFARVLEVEGELQICSRDKEVGNLYDMFHTRSTLHRRAYQHKTTNIVDTMLVEALEKANDYLKFTGENGKQYRMSEAIYDMKAFIQLTDNVFHTILYSTDSNLKKSREILENILRRKLYKCIGQTHLKNEHVISMDKKDEIRSEVLKHMDPDELSCSGLTVDDIIIHLINLDYGMKEKNPVDNVRFYSKHNPNVAVRVRKDQVSNLLPDTFAEQQILVHSKITDPRTLDMVKKAFSSWCKHKGFPAPKGGEVNALELTPVTKGDSKTASPMNTNGIRTEDATPNGNRQFKSKLSFD
ncbi:SAM domain and HD [Mactra antiquata]